MQISQPNEERNRREGEEKHNNNNCRAVPSLNLQIFSHKNKNNN
jgi:hypothetical protein